ncbi:MAG: autotransporter outer membrane beta-barrel domain-containing protein [Candidatus Gastranaerophilales bacterium]|nr:autotransporter outer membrane beta-barrel domain-containing protein [Candidatus Gastranaerophilales bacterium]
MEEILFTNLNFAGNTVVNGNTDGSNDTFNTLAMKNTGNLSFNGKEMSVFSLNNTGTITFGNPEDLNMYVQCGQITGNGLLLFNNGLTLSGVSYIENTLDIGSNFLNIMDGNKDRIDISKFNSNDALLLLDYGDTFVLQNDSDAGNNTITLKQIAISDNDATSLDSTEKIKLFEEKTPTTPTAITLDVNSSVNLYYNKNKYAFSQDNTDKSYLLITKTPGAFELSDAIADSSTAKYIVTDDDTVTKDLGTVQGAFFEISGEDINVNGHSGLVVDGTINAKTTLKTNIYGASDSNITLINNANRLIQSKDEDITIGNKNETAVTIDNSYLEASLENNAINFGGKITGLNDKTKNLVALSAKQIDLNSVENVTMLTTGETVNLNNSMTDTIWQMKADTVNILNDAYLSSDGSNQIIVDAKMINTANNQAGNIYLSKMTVNNDFNMSIDVDLNTLEADRFVFQNANDLITGGNDLNIVNVNLINSGVPLEQVSYAIPFVSSEYNNQKFLNSVSYKQNKEIMTPIFKYNFGYAEDGTEGCFVLSRGSSSDYKSYNPSVLSSGYAAQTGGFFNQLTSYNLGFANMDMNMLLTKEERTAMKYRNKYADAEGMLTYDPNQLIQEKKSLWFRPHATFEKINVSNGGTVENTSYGSFVGGESEIIELRHGWNAQYSVFAGYNGSHQRFSDVSVYQNGGQLGINGYLYKGNFFTGLTASVGASAARASSTYGSEDFTMLSTGVASKTGYNWELAKGKFIIQPNYLMSYSFVNTFDYTNAAGVRITSDPLNAIQIAPGIKFIGNLKNGWQPYLAVTMVWNIMDKTNFRANNVSLPQMSIDPYIQYGVGLKKKWKDRFTGFAQAMITNGGRNGVSLTAGFSWSLGK